MIVKHSFGVWIVRIRRILFELCLINRRKKEERKKNKIEIFTLYFLDCEKKSCDSEGVFYIRIAKGFHL